MTSATTTTTLVSGVAAATTAALGLAIAALPHVLFTWRCRNQRCRKMICELEWNGRAILRHRCSCNTDTQLPEHAACSLRTDRSKW